MALDRSVIPINISLGQRRQLQVNGFENVPWIEVYSDVLNYWMHRFLDFYPNRRITTMEAVETMGRAFDEYIRKVKPEEFDAYVQKVETPTATVDVVSA
jgi:hypothetical protein